MTASRLLAASFLALSLLGSADLAGAQELYA